MFIHWGPISQMGKQLSHSRNSPSHRSKGGRPYKTASIPPEIYDVQYKTFNPVNLDAGAMMRMAKEAGVAYVVFTAKHHAGFSMFDSAVTEYDIMSAPYKKDITRELADAARANGIDFGFYYSPRDWYHPDCDSDENHPRYIRFYKAQMKELLENYGPIHEIFFDGLGPGDWGNTAEEVMRMIRDRHPDCMVNDRGGAGADYYTPEHYVSYYNPSQPWEACHTTTGQWGYNPDVGPKDFAQLMEILLYTWGGDGNILLNIGPMGDGGINPVEKERFKQIAAWWKVHGEDSIRGTRGGPYLPGPWGVSTRKDNRVFLHVFRWGESDTLSFPKLEGRAPSRPLKLFEAKRLDGKPVKVKSTKGTYEITVPKPSRHDPFTTIELTFDGPTREIDPLQRIPSLTTVANVDVSASEDPLTALFDQNAHTEWKGKSRPGEEEIWIETRFEKPMTIASFSAPRGENWVPRHKAVIQVPDGNGEWKTISGKFNRFRFTTMNFLPEPVTTDRIRLLITGAKAYSGEDAFVMAEWELYPPVSK
jgi:alpha-L-fucosidase